jgi:hypothetical protein
MKLNDIVSTMKIGAIRTGRDVKAHLPEIIFTLATGCIVKGVYEGCKATPEWKNTMTYHEDKLDDIQRHLEMDEITEQEAAVETGKEYLGLSKDFLFKYGKCILFTAGGIALMGGDLCYLKKENRDLKHALFDMALGTAAYRNRVAEFVGKDKEYDLFHNIKREMVEEEYIDENGKKKKRMVEKVVNGSDEQVAGDHNSFFFGVGNVHYNDMASNVTFLSQTEEMFNRMLKGRGDYGTMDRAEMFRFLKVDDRFPAESKKMGGIYIKAEDEARNYEYPYSDPTLPRIIKFDTSKDFGISTGETWVDINCIPIYPLLEKKEKEIISCFGKRSTGSKYIATI